MKGIEFDELLFFKGELLSIQVI